MSDNLRGSGTGATMIPQSPCMPADPGTCLIPLREPYTALYGTNPLTQASNIALPAVSEPAGESTTASILGVAGELGIVDWIYIELRNSVNPATVVATKRVLLARNSFAIDPVTGLNEIKFNTMPAGNYIVSVKHRNHLGLQTLNSFFLGVVGPTPCGTTIDFTLPSLPLFTLTGVTTPKVVLFSATKQGMIPGDVLKTANPTTVSFPYASSNDFNMINTILSFAAPCPANPNGQTFGYGKTDVNLDRKTNNTGATNEQLTMQQIQSIMGITGSIILSQHTSN
jgi:hypothetical protein